MTSISEVRLYGADSTSKNLEEINQSNSSSSVETTSNVFMIDENLAVDETTMSELENEYSELETSCTSQVKTESEEEQTPEALRDELDEINSEQGFIGKAWSWVKNTFNVGASSEKAEQAIKDFEDGKISYEEAQEKIQSYEDGQEDSVEFVGDVAGVVASVAITSVLSVVAPGIGTVAGTIISGGICAATKAGVKYVDAQAGGRDYTTKDLLWDAGSGFVSGALSVAGSKIAGKVATKVASKVPAFGKLATWMAKGSKLAKFSKWCLGITDDLAEVGAKKGAEIVAKSTVGNLVADVNKGAIMGTVKTAKGMILDGKEFSTEDLKDNVVSEVIKYGIFARFFGNLTSSGTNYLNIKADKYMKNVNIENLSTKEKIIGLFSSNPELGDSKIADIIEDAVKDISKKAFGGEASRLFNRLVS